MKVFIRKIISYGILVIVTYAILGFFADGHTDPFYLRLTSPKQKSLVLGTSRTAQGIQPKYLNKYITIEGVSKPIYNYGFTVLHSPYGETYFNAITAKVDTTSHNGLFILAVDPWNLGSRIDINYQRETKKELGKINFYNISPNYDYLTNAYKKSMFTLPFTEESSMFLQKDGWLEVDVDMTPEKLKDRTVSKVEMYDLNLQFYKVSNSRILWLKKTVAFLSNYGEAIMIRIPIGKEILNIENKLSPNFDTIISENFKSIRYLNYKDDYDSYEFTDGNHLYKESGKEFSIKLAKDINHILREENKK
jgi:hypothetical protein